LAVANLGDHRLGGSSLRLAIRDLGDNWASRSGLRCGGLGLAVRDLGDDGAGRAGLGGGSLWLTIGDLGDTSGLRSLRLAIADLRNTTSRSNCYNVDWNTLCTSALTVQVIEGTRLARVPDGWGRAAARRECEGAVAADGEASGFTSTCLERIVELEPMNESVGHFTENLVNLLVVGSDVSLTTGLIPEDTIVEVQSQSTRKLA
jgi:hypothetical protein